jgi:hypothetical protein
VAGDRVDSLETNRLSTFVGEPVSYSFRLGSPGQAESAQLTLTPQQILGDVVRVEVDVTATLPGAQEEPLLVSRTEQWVTSRGASSTISLATGEPPSGYRFVVTPRF